MLYKSTVSCCGFLNFSKPTIMATLVVIKEPSFHTMIWLDASKGAG